jgi:uncharacterized protein Yka (UPF0111/DUF47 family)
VAWVRLNRPPDPALLALFEEASANALATCRLVRDLFARFPEDDGLATQVRDAEHEGDRLAHEILQRLARRGERRVHIEAADIHALTMAIDDVVDHAEEAADQLSRYGVEAPLEAAEQLADVLVATAERVHESVHGFANRADVSPTLLEVHKLEKQADRLVRDSVASLFTTGIDPMIVIRWKDILETLESAVDACETVANVLEGLSLKRGGRPVLIERDSSAP